MTPRTSCMSTNILKKPAPFNFRVTLSTTQRSVTYQTTVIIIFQICSVSNTRKRSIWHNISTQLLDTVSQNKAYKHTLGHGFLWTVVQILYKIQQSALQNTAIDTVLLHYWKTFERLLTLPFYIDTPFNSTTTDTQR